MSDVIKKIDELVAKAKVAAEKFKGYTQEQVDMICAKMNEASVANEQLTAEMAVEETNMGVVAHKAIKNHCATLTYEYFKDKKSVGVIDEKDSVAYIAEPFGVIAAALPVTNPTSTVVFKALCAAKTRNVIIMAFHPKSQKCSAFTAKLMLDAAVGAGAPEDFIQWVDEPSIEATNALFKHPGVKLVWATGGGAMVKSAFSSGHPALGVGPGNCPSIITKTANHIAAVNNIIASKTFDNGTTCPSEQNILFDDKSTCDKTIAIFKQKGCYVVNAEEKAKLEAVMFDKEKGVSSGNTVGRTAHEVAELAGISIPSETKLMLVPINTIAKEEWFSHEKLCPVLSYITCDSVDAAVKGAKELLEQGGAGHTASIHTQNEEDYNKFTTEVPANRLLLNTPSLHGAIGIFYTNLPPTLSLSCGPAGGNYLSHNLNFKDLLNIKSAARRIVGFEMEE
jgi:acetaldehyde dehydrogenase/alcohol dehydrogenase